MMTPLILCLYLLLLVIDLVVMGKLWGFTELVLIGGFHLVMFLVGISMFRNEFAALAEKYQTRVVFSPRVYGFFSLASGLFASALITSGTFLSFLARGILFSLLLFRTGVQLFDFFPVRTRQVQRTVFWSSLLGVAAVAVVAWGSVISLFGNTPVQQQMPTQDAPDTVELVVESGAVQESGVSLEDIENMQLSGGVELSGGVVGSGDEQPATSTGSLSGIQDLDVNEPITYRVLLPYLDEKGLLPEVRETPTFANVSKQEDIYQSFQRAWGLKMVGTNVQPNRQVRCENFMVLLGLAQDWTVNASLPVLDAYWQAATARNVLGSCATRDQVATQDMLVSVE